jgi:hypothetical protein
MIGLIVFGYMFLLYGILKCILCYLDIVLTYKQRVHLLNNTPWFKHVLTLDTTTAGKTISILYIIFAFITIFKATERIHTGTIHSDVIEIVNERLFVYLIYGLLGAFLFITYCLVIYTNLDISKNLQYSKRYKLMGICGGLVFILSVPILITFHNIHDYGLHKAIQNHLLLFITTFIISLLIIGTLLYFAYTIIYDEKECKTNSISFSDILTLLIIPSNII